MEMEAPFDGLLVLPGALPEFELGTFDTPAHIVTRLGHIPCVAGVRKGRVGELGRETAREGGGGHLQASHCFCHPAR